MKISGVVCVGACGVCMCGVGECVEGGGGQHCGTILSQRNCFFRKIGMRLLHVSFDEIHCTVIT